MTTDREGPPLTEQARKASEQSSVLRGVFGYLNNLAMTKPDFGPDDLLELSLGLQRLTRRIDQQKTPLSETEVIPGVRAVNIAQKDLDPTNPSQEP